MVKGYKHLTAGQESQVLDLYRQTLRTRPVAAELGVSVDQIRRCLKRHNIPLSNSTGGACYQRIEDIRQWAAEGLTFSEIARRVGTKHQLVAKFLREHEIPYTPFDRSAPENNPAWKGGRMVDKDGYILIHYPDHPRCNRHGYVREHRLVMESVLGRYLTPQEVVHHRDGDRQHNAPENLEVFEENGRHLAETLAGRPKNMTSEGRERLRESGRQLQRARRMSNPTA